ncbi:hypothetical protein BDB01DRAFT_904728 [Pilobolus umbonatus]|nr:hypothetical protein BDB01DRAFT_904728 [Pilobolus umbonatus]
MLIRLQMCKMTMLIADEHHAANIIWLGKASEVYRPKAIVGWAKQFLEYGIISPRRQGCHIKRQSFLADEDVKNAVIGWIKDQRSESLSLISLKKFIEESIVPEYLSVAGLVSEGTVRNYLHLWGYTYKTNNKDIYFDGHEREDVVVYRKEWCQRMIEHMRYMDRYVGEDLTVVEGEAVRSGGKKRVLVTYDKSTFYANDRKKEMWIREGENPIRKKGPGMSIMVSEFQCRCHGTMRVKEWTSRKLFEAGASRQGYWKSADMIKQLVEDAIPLFELLHEGCVAVFIFIQNSNHQAYASNALLAQRMSLNEVLADPGKPEFRVTRARKIDGTFFVQDMYENRTEKIMSVSRKGKEKEVVSRYFKAQKSALQEAVEDNGHFFDLYPKFHCECNWIERDWGGAMKLARLHCDYSYKSLKEKINVYLDEVGEISHIQRYYRKCLGYIEVYHSGMGGLEAVKEVKRISSTRCASHRRAL